MRVMNGSVNELIVVFYIWTRGRALLMRGGEEVEANQLMVKRQVCSLPLSAFLFRLYFAITSKFVKIPLRIETVKYFLN